MTKKDYLTYMTFLIVVWLAGPSNPAMESSDDLNWQPLSRTWIADQETVDVWIMTENDTNLEEEDGILYIDNVKMYETPI